MPMLASLLVRGNVQGVGFRVYAVSCAQSLGITGTVRNLPDGAVEIECECETDAQLEEFKRSLAIKEAYGIKVLGIETKLAGKEAKRHFRDFRVIG